MWNFGNVGSWIGAPVHMPLKVEELLRKRHALSPVGAALAFRLVLAALLFATVTSVVSGQTLGVIYTPVGGTPTYLSNTNVVYITGDQPPAMPTIQVFVNRFTNGQGVTACGTINYWVFFDWTSPSDHPGGHTASSHTYPSQTVPEGTVTCGTSNTMQTIDFRLLGSFYGGTMKILWKLVGSGQATQEIDLAVLGINPQPSSVDSVLASQAYSVNGQAVTFPAQLHQGIIYAESGSNGFIQPQNYYHQFRIQKCKGSGCYYGTYNYNVNSGAGGPLWSANPQGLGLGQIDFSQEKPAKTPPVADYWNWVNNLSESRQILQAKLNIATSDWDSSFQKSGAVPPTGASTTRSYDNAGQWNGNTLTYPASGGCSFSYNPNDTQNSFIFAGATKGYNGFHSALMQAQGNKQTKLSESFLNFVPGMGWVLDDYAPNHNSPNQAPMPYVQAICTAPQI